MTRRHRGNKCRIASADDDDIKFTGEMIDFWSLCDRLVLPVQTAHYVLAEGDHKFTDGRSFIHKKRSVRGRFQIV